LHYYYYYYLDHSEEEAPILKHSLVNPKLCQISLLSGWLTSWGFSTSQNFCNLQQIHDFVCVCVCVCERERERERVPRLFLTQNLGNVFPNVSVLVSSCFLNCGFVMTSLFMIFYHVFLWLHGKSSTISSIDCYYPGMKWMAMKHEVQLDDKHVIAFETI